MAMKSMWDGQVLRTVLVQDALLSMHVGLNWCDAAITRDGSDGFPPGSEKPANWHAVC